MSHDYLSETPFLDYRAPSIQKLIVQRGWAKLPEGERIGAAGFRELAYRLVIRHWMNRRVAQMRAGRVPLIPGGNKNLLPVKYNALKKEAV